MIKTPELSDKAKWMKPTQRVVNDYGQIGTITEVIMYPNSEYVHWLEVRFDHLKHDLPIRPDSLKPLDFSNLKLRVFDKQEAIKKMKEGHKVTHRFFNDGEWMKMENGALVFEDGEKIELSEFFRLRYSEDWNSGYTLFISK